MNIEQEIQLILNDSSLIIDEHVQSLWSGYGKIVRCKSLINSCSYIVKIIAPQNATKHPRGWNSSTSHHRKLKSYQVEACFYQNYAKLTDENCKVPKQVASHHTDDYTLLVMEDLHDIGYFVEKESGDWKSLSVAIKWLAYFHMKFMKGDGKGLWPVGSYWHLDTRKDEFEAMPDSVFKSNAKAIHDRLNNASFKTLIHGDAKFDNLCFHYSGNNVAAVDFQYIGHGAGVKDLAYLVGSCLDNEALIKYDKQVVREYLSFCKQAVIDYQINIDFDAFEKEVLQLYPVAWADFYRFLLGWNPDSWKICDHMKNKAEQGLLHI